MGKLTDKIHTLIIYDGYIETTTAGCLIFSNEGGFNTPDEAVKNFILTALIAEWDVMANERGIVLEGEDRVKTEQDFWVFIKKHPDIRFNLIKDLPQWFNREAHKFDHWEAFNQNGWNLWSLERGKFLSVENITGIIENSLDCLDEDEEPNFNFNWNMMNYTIGSLEIEKK